MMTFEEAKTLKPGERVRFAESYDNYPHVFVVAGETGTVATNDLNEKGDLWIKLDNVHDGLAAWENEVQVWGPHTGDRAWTDSACVVRE